MLLPTGDMVIDSMHSPLFWLILWNGFGWDFIVCPRPNTLVYFWDLNWKILHSHRYNKPILQCNVFRNEGIIFISFVWSYKNVIVWAVTSNQCVLSSCAATPQSRVVRRKRVNIHEAFEIEPSTNKCSVCVWHRFVFFFHC